jgi:hypothetical protein
LEYYVCVCRCLAIIERSTLFSVEFIFPINEEIRSCITYSALLPRLAKAEKARKSRKKAEDQPLGRPPIFHGNG